MKDAKSRRSICKEGQTEKVGSDSPDSIQGAEPIDSVSVDNREDRLAIDPPDPG